MEVVVVGQIGGMPNVWTDTHPDFPWYAGQSSFFLVDTKIAAQFATHAKKHGGNHSCAFLPKPGGEERTCRRGREPGR